MFGLSAVARAQGGTWFDWLPESFRDASFLDIAGWQWIALIGLLLIGYSLGMILRVLLARFFGISKGRFSHEISAPSARTFRRAVALLVASLVWSMGITSFQLPERPLHALERVIEFIVVVAFTWLGVAVWEIVADLLGARGQQGKATSHLVMPLIRRLGRFVILTIGGVFLVSTLGYNVSALLAGLGIGGIALALAAKDSVENLFGSLTIVLDMPFSVGDWIKLDKIDGVVEEINLRSTRVRTADDSVITLPNSNLIKASVENMGARRFRRFRTQLLIAGQAPVSAIKIFVDKGRAALEASNKVRQSDASLTLFDFSDGGVRIQLSAYLEADNLPDELAERERIMEALLAAAGDSGIQIGPTGSAYSPASE